MRVGLAHPVILASAGMLGIALSFSCGGGRTSTDNAADAGDSDATGGSDGSMNADSGIDAAVIGPRDASGAGDSAADGGGEIDDVATAFSAVSNPTPTGHFEFGMTPTLAGTFLPFAHLVTAQSLPLWQASTTPNTPPYVGKNTTSQNVTWFNTVTLPAGTVWAHPGASGEYSVVRWTCPSSGNYLVNVSFSARDTTSTNVAVLRDGAMPPVFAGNVSPSSSPSYSNVLALAAGDTIDFAVGYGSDGNYANDSTGIAASIEKH